MAWLDGPWTAADSHATIAQRVAGDLASGPAGGVRTKVSSYVAPVAAARSLGRHVPARRPPRRRLVATRPQADPHDVRDAARSPRALVSRMTRRPRLIDRVEWESATARGYSVGRGGLDAAARQEEDRCRRP